jgi:hypothetical protein
MASARLVDKQGAQPDDTAGSLETEVNKLLASRELPGEMPLIAAEARTLARSGDRLGQTHGGAAAMALATVSRRLEETMARLQVPKEDNIDRLQRAVRERRALARAAQNGGSGT